MVAVEKKVNNMGKAKTMLVEFYIEDISGLIYYCEFRKSIHTQSRKEFNNGVLTRLMNVLYHIDNDHPGIKTTEITKELFLRYRNVNKATWECFQTIMNS
jgi:hypothetical protein